MTTTPPLNDLMASAMESIISISAALVGYKIEELTSHFEELRGKYLLPRQEEVNADSTKRFHRKQDEF